MGGAGGGGGGYHNNNSWDRGERGRDHNKEDKRSGSANGHYRTGVFPRDDI